MPGVLKSESKAVSMNLIRILASGILMIITVARTYTQDYIPFNFQEGIWMEHKFEKSDINPLQTILQLFCNGDTSIDGNTYNRLYEYNIVVPTYGFPDTNFTHYIGAIRNVVSEKQVLFVEAGQESEAVIYDFNLELGDTVPSLFDFYIISEIDSIKFCGRYHRKYVLGGYPSDYLVEGIGYGNGLLGYRNPPTGGENTHMLDCYTERGNQQCDDCNLLVGYRNEMILAGIYPNPTSGIIHINSESQISSIRMLDLSGRELLFRDFTKTNNPTVDIGSLQHGVYCMQVIFENAARRSFIIVRK